MNEDSDAERMRNRLLQHEIDKVKCSVPPILFVRQTVPDDRHEQRKRLIRALADQQLNSEWGEECRDDLTAWVLHHRDALIAILSMEGPE